MEKDDVISILTIKEGTEIIDKDAYADHTELKEAKLPDSIIEMGASSFLRCTNLEKIKAILAEFKNSDILLCYGDVLNKRKYLKEPCLKDILKLFDGHKIKCLGTTQNGLPKHPSRISTKSEIIDFKFKNDNK